MPLPSLHPLPNNPTTGQAPSASLRNGVPPASAAGGGGVSRETLKGLQDVYWSDDEDDPDCLLCAEPLDLSDLNFKPCQCGMQICQFCYNKLLTTDSRCPGCRRPYDAKAVVFQPVDWEEVKRAKEKKTRRAKTIKQLTSMGRRHLLSVRVVMKNMVYVVGMKIPGTGDEAISILRSNDYFGQYGKISKLYLRERSNSTAVSPNDVDAAMAIYVVYVRREDAARAISALDGIPAPQGSAGQTLRACFGTTRYCDAFLKGQKCDNSACTNLHEWGGDSDCFTKDDYELALIRPAEYDARQKQAQITAPPPTQKASWPKPSSIDETLVGSSLPSSAAWGKGVPIARPAPRSAAPIGTSRPVKPPVSIPITLPLKSNAAFPLPTPSPVQPPPVKEKKEKKEKASAMARGKSTDSSMSGTPSAQVSPKRKPSALAPVTAIKAVPAPPPGLSAPSSSVSTPVDQKPPTLAPAPAPEVHTSEPVPDLQDNSSASEAGPSSSSPTPQTPARLSENLPPPLTDEPIFVHSPYEEPSIFSFPYNDPAFAFVLGIDPEDAERFASEFTYQPSPFSKTLVGLAELGILAPEIPDLTSIPPRRDSSAFSGTFQPFDPLEPMENVEEDANAPGPSSLKTPARTRPQPTQEEEDWEVEGPRTTSRFDFARPSSRATSGRGQSPFALTRNQRDDREREEWRTAQQADAFGPASGQGQGQGQSLSQAGHGLLAGFAGGGGGEWGMNSGHGSPYSARDTREGGRYKRDREEYDQGMRYPQNQHQLFSPDRPTSALDEFGSPAHPSSVPPGFLHASQQNHGSPLYDPRGHYGQQQQQQQQQQRPQSPTPLSSGLGRSGRSGR